MQALIFCFYLDWKSVLWDLHALFPVSNEWKNLREKTKDKKERRLSLIKLVLISRSLFWLEKNIGAISSDGNVLQNQRNGKRSFIDI